MTDLLRREDLVLVEVDEPTRLLVKGRWEPVCVRRVVGELRVDEVIDLMTRNRVKVMEQAFI